MSDVKIPEDIEQAYRAVRQMLLVERDPGGFWVGQLSSSALATATALSALSVTGRPQHADLIDPGVAWLVRTQNPDGGWGDTTNSPSNLATTTLVRAALTLADAQDTNDSCIRRVDEYLRTHAGSSGKELASALGEIYGRDRTFAVPILTNCAIADMVEWNDVPPLPFEIACLPQSILHLFSLHVVSYALPALIAIGQLLHQRRHSPNVFLNTLRRFATRPTLTKLTQIQPGSGGFLEATPLTSFVVMSLAAAGRAEHPVARKGLDFLRRSAHPDGSWPIDTNLSTWLTTQAVRTPGLIGSLPEPMLTRDWLLAQQHKEPHPYTATSPGGWSWTPLAGGVPDADDTAGALLALRVLGPDVPEAAVRSGLKWLAGLQNDAGGIPTFCRGWSKLPFDRSTPDLTAHAMRAFHAWKTLLPPNRYRKIVEAGFGYLSRVQNPDGSWLPLWFGNQEAPGQSNPLYGTARVLKAYGETGRTGCAEVRRGVAFLGSIQNSDGGWGGAKGVRSSVEETALAVEVLCDFADDAVLWEKTLSGTRYLVRQISEGALAEGRPIGLYFTTLWYWEKLYPVIWSLGAFAAVLNRLKTAGKER